VALNSERGLTVVMVSHDEATAREVSHRVFRLLDGRVIDELSGRADG
jgi:ABC-type sulfate/molybdate transport systems ATPase subunit